MIAGAYAEAVAAADRAVVELAELLGLPEPARALGYHERWPVSTWAMRTALPRWNGRSLFSSSKGQDETLP